jgi:hypothetical protein
MVHIRTKLSSRWNEFLGVKDVIEKLRTVDFMPPFKPGFGGRFHRPADHYGRHEQIIES